MVLINFGRRIEKNKKSSDRVIEPTEILEAKPFDPNRDIELLMNIFGDDPDLIASKINDKFSELKNTGEISYAIKILEMNITNYGEMYKNSRKYMEQLLSDPKNKQSQIDTQQKILSRLENRLKDWSDRLKILRIYKEKYQSKTIDNK
jgi:hypothetical protein